MKSTLSVALLMSFSLNSCKRTDEAVTPEGPVRLIVNMLGVEDADEPLALANGGASSKLASVDQTGGHTVYSEAIQETTAPFDDNKSIVATLVPQSMSAVSGTSASLNRVSATQAEAKAVVGPIQTNLTPGVMYRMLVYESSGKFIAQQDYVRGSEATTPAITGLTAGVQYTFVVYSINSSSKDDFPKVTTILSNNLLLSFLILDRSDGAFMIFKTSKKLNNGDNVLDIVLKNKYSEITTRIELDDRDFSPSSNIREISGVTIGPGYNAATLALGSDIAADFSNYSSPIDAPVEFPAIGSGTRSLISTPTLILTDGAIDNGILKIASLRIGNTIKRNISLSRLKITPGHKYNLNISVQDN